jgi:hypothetical protein
MSKKLNTDQIRQDLEGSAFFPNGQTGKERTPPEPTQDSKHASKQASKQASTLASKPTKGAAPMLPQEWLTAIRKTVRVPGREVTYVRLSSEEKARLFEVVSTYKLQGHKITETEISRIAVNFILEDYRAHGEQSILAQALAALRE